MEEKTREIQDATCNNIAPPTSQVHEGTSSQSNVKPLIYDGLIGSGMSFRRNIEAYCTVRSPRRFSLPQSAYLVEMGNHMGAAIQTTDLDDSEDDISVRSSYDSTTQSLLKHFDEDGSFDEIDLSSTKDDDITLDATPSFEDDFVPTTVIENPAMTSQQVPTPCASSNYCTIRGVKKSKATREEQIAATYATMRLKVPVQCQDKTPILRRANTTTSLEKVEDYLSELDSYLATMDDSPSHIGATAPEKSPHKQTSRMSLHANSFFTLPKQLRKVMKRENNLEEFKRTYSMRQVPVPNWTEPSTSSGKTSGEHRNYLIFLISTIDLENIDN